MEGFIEEDAPNGATHGEGLFSGTSIFHYFLIPGPFTTITTKLFFSRLLVSELATTGLLVVVYYYVPD